MFREWVSGLEQGGGQYGQSRGLESECVACRLCCVSWSCPGRPVGQEFVFSMWAMVLSPRWDLGSWRGGGDLKHIVISSW